MAVEALWLVEFSSPNKGTWGKGVAVFETQRIFGGDSGYYYIGHYSLDYINIEAEVRIKQHFMGTQSIFHPLTNVTVIFEKQSLTNGLENTIIKGYVKEDPEEKVEIKFTKLSELP